MESNKNYIRLEKVKVMQGLETALTEVVEHMKFAPLENCGIWTDKQMETLDNKCDTNEPSDSLDAICVDGGPNSSAEITNIPHLVLQLFLDYEQEKRFQELENASLYTENKVLRGQFTIDCGDDIAKAAYLYSEVARLVFLFDGERVFQLREYLKWEDNPDSFHMNFRFPPEKLRNTEFTEEITRKVEAYNQKAAKQGAPLLSWDVTKGILTGQSVKGKAKSGLLHSLKCGLYAACGKGLPMEGSGLRRQFLEICSLCGTATAVCQTL